MIRLACRRGLGRGHLPAARAAQRRQDDRVQPVEGGIRQPEQGVVLPDPLVPALPSRPARSRPGRRPRRTAWPGPGAASNPRGRRACPRRTARTSRSRPCWPGDGLARRFFLGVPMSVPQRDEQLALPPEVMVEAAHARPGALDHVRDAGVGDPCSVNTSRAASSSARCVSAVRAHCQGRAAALARGCRAGGRAESAIWPPLPLLPAAPFRIRFQKFIRYPGGLARARPRARAACLRLAGPGSRILRSVP